MRMIAQESARFFLIGAYLQMSAFAIAEEKPKNCVSQIYELTLSGGEANAFFSKCSEQAKIVCEQSVKTRGVAKMRALRKCLKEGIGN